MSGVKGAFSSLQKIGKSLMLPVSVLPAAGILLGVGSAKFTWLPVAVSTWAAAGVSPSEPPPPLEIATTIPTRTAKVRIPAAP